MPSGTCCSAQDSRAPTSAGAWVPAPRDRARRAPHALPGARTLAEPRCPGGSRPVPGALGRPRSGRHRPEPAADPPTWRQATGPDAFSRGCPSAPAAAGRRPRAPPAAPAPGCTTRSAGGAARRVGCGQAGVPTPRATPVTTLIGRRFAGSARRSRGSDERAGRADPRAEVVMAGLRRDGLPERRQPCGREPPAPVAAHRAGARSVRGIRAGEPFRPSGPAGAHPRVPADCRPRWREPSPRPSALRSGREGARPPAWRVASPARSGVPSREHPASSAGGASPARARVSLRSCTSRSSEQRLARARTGLPRLGSLPTNLRRARPRAHGSPSAAPGKPHDACFGCGRARTR